MDRRSVLKGAGALVGAAALSQPGLTATRRHRRIATEEAFQTPAVAAALRDISATDSKNADMELVRRYYGATVSTFGQNMLDALLDVEGQRLEIMDRNEVDMHVLSLTSPGVQMFAPGLASELARASNDYLAGVISRHPTRFSGLAAFAPQDSTNAVKEMERAITSLKLNGFIVNSHTFNHYLDEPQFDGIMEAAAGLNRPIYIHPRAPSDGMAVPFRQNSMEYATWGFAVETGTHAVRMILSGVFDRHPNLKIALGHMGEGVPYWLWRLDFMNSRHAGRNAAVKLKLKPSEYFKRNFVITTSGMETVPVLKYCLDVLGPDNVLWAIDYPYQPTEPATRFMNEAEISEDVRAKLFHQNAERFFHIPARAPGA